MSATDRCPTPTVPIIKAATSTDIPAIAEVFARAFGEYRLALGCDTAALARLWAPLIAARRSNWHVARAHIPARLPRNVPGRLIGILAIESSRRSTRVGRARDCGRWQSGGGELGIRGTAAGLLCSVAPWPSRMCAGHRAAMSCTWRTWPWTRSTRTKGIGRRLLATAAERAHQRGYRRLSLHVAASNAAALHLYESAGFSREVTIRMPYRGPLGIPAFIEMRSG